MVSFIIHRIDGFQETANTHLFSVFHCRLVHGWLLDPQDPDTAAVLCSLSYDEAVERVFLMQDTLSAIEKGQGFDNSKDQENMDKIRDGKEARSLLFTPNVFNSSASGTMINQFLESTSSQLTYHGLSELHRHLRDGEIAILFRNNHFSTILKRCEHPQVNPTGKIYALVTDEGYQHEGNVVWETLSNVEGDEDFLDGHFKLYDPNRPAETHNNAAASANLTPVLENIKLDTSPQGQEGSISGVNEDAE